MTKQELNRDIKRLYNNIFEMSLGDLDAFYKYIDNVAKPEFNRLFWADKDFCYMNLKSIKIMLRLNVKHRFVPFHLFGLYIEL